MGAKNPAINKQTRQILSKTCEECQRDFLTIAALKSHIMAKHPEKSKQMQSNDAEKDGKTAFVPPTSRVSKRLLQKKSVDKEIESENNNCNDSDPKKTVFECPKCSKVFQVYFSACRHIEKRHSVDDDGKPISSDLLNLIKPIRKEICIDPPKPNDGANNFGGDLSPSIGEITVNGYYSCLGCGRTFTSVSSFDNHIPGSHSDNVDSMFFENNNDFQMWKCDMESQVKVKYLSLNKNLNRQYYQCNYVSPKNSAHITHLCPSVLIVTEFSKGIQVHYYKRHYEHSCQYKNSLKYEKFVIKPQLGDNIINKKHVGDLYSKVKDLLNSIITGSAKINVTHLKKLYDMALDMQTFLNSYDEDYEETDIALQMQAYISVKKSVMSVDNINNDEKEQNLEQSTEKEADTTNKSMNDDQITKALEATRASARLKRKSVSSTPVSKKQKVESDPVSKKQTVESDEKPIETKASIIENISTPKNAKLDSPRVTKSAAINQSPSFNDSYKQFIDSTLNIPSKNKGTSSTKKINNKKEIVKTKIGQFIPSPKKVTKTLLDTENIDNNIVVTKNNDSFNSPKTGVDYNTVIARKKEYIIPPKAVVDNTVITKKKDNTNSPKVGVDNPAVMAKKKESINSLKTTVDTPKKKDSINSPKMCVEKNTTAAKKKDSINSPRMSVEKNTTTAKRKDSISSPRVVEKNTTTGKRKDSINSPSMSVERNTTAPKKKESISSPRMSVEKITTTAKKKNSIKSITNAEIGTIAKKNESIKIPKSPKTRLANINIKDLKYEVVEQENDCNILVLKF